MSAASSGISSETPRRVKNGRGPAPARERGPGVLVAGPASTGVSDTPEDAGHESESGSAPEPPDPRAVAGDHPYAVETHARLQSTNDRARELAAAGEREVAVVAATQTAGRGRRGRSWAGPVGGLYLSVVTTPPTAPAEYPLVTLAAGVAVVRAVATTAGEADPGPRVKWPNDVLVGDRKLAGVLTERVDDAVVVGVGVNVTTDPADLPERATSLRAETRATPDRDALARELLVAFGALVAEPDSVLPAWRAVADTLGRRVRVSTPDGAVVGEAVDVERPGRLVVRTADGTVRVDAGDCEHLRPAD
jgi:BirA family biotin operon repressor/biotin-[acetyl-CoA-carboxylase] ligase